MGKAEVGKHGSRRGSNGNPDQYRFDALHAAPMTL
jgi:hypothetical protein